MIRTEDGRKKNRREQFSKLANESFNKLELIVEQAEGPVRMWYCVQPGTVLYSFRVIAAPGALFVYGDVGNHMLRASDYDLVPWLKGAVKSPMYLISKFVGIGDSKNVFLEGEAEDLLNNSSEEVRNKVKKEYWENYISWEQFSMSYWEADGDTEALSSVLDYDASVYWTVECLKKFVDLLGESKEEEVSICSSITAILDK